MVDADAAPSAPKPWGSIVHSAHPTTARGHGSSPDRRGSKSPGFSLLGRRGEFWLVSSCLVVSYRPAGIVALVVFPDVPCFFLSLVLRCFHIRLTIVEVVVSLGRGISDGEIALYLGSLAAIA